MKPFDKKLGWPKRAWHYIQRPSIYAIQCDQCGGDNLHWSEWDKLIWCYDCEIDTRGTEGIFDGPIPVNLCRMMGISFDRVNLRSNVLTGDFMERDFIFIQDGKLVEPSKNADAYISRSKYDNDIKAQRRLTEDSVVERCTAYYAGYHAASLGVPQTGRDSGGKAVCLLTPYNYGYSDSKNGREPDFKSVLMSQDEFNKKRIIHP